MEATKSVKELLEMIDNCAESTLIYSYTIAGFDMWWKLNVLWKLVEDADNAITDYEDSNNEPAPKTMYDVYDSLYAAHRALYEKYGRKADEYVQDLIDCNRK